MTDVPQTRRVRLSRADWLAMLVPLLIVLGYFGWHLTLTPKITFAVDDAYITQHNATVLLAGRDPNFPEASPLHGATSALHLLIIAGLGLVMPIPLAQFLVGLVAALALAVGLVVLGRRLGAPPLIAGLIGVAGVTCGEVLHHVTNGLETGLAMALLTWTLAEIEGPPRRRRWSVPVLLGLLPFARPEFIALSGLLGLFYLWRERPLSLRSLGMFVLPVAATALPFAIWYLVATGVPWPSTIGAKQLFYAATCHPLSSRIQVARDHLVQFVLMIGPFALGLLLLARTNLGRLVLAFIVIFIGTYVVLLPMALSYYEHRYVYVLVPTMALGFASFAASGERWKWPTAAVLTGAIVVSLVFFHSRAQAHVSRLGYTTDELDPVAEWVKHHLPSDARILIHDAGRISIDSPFALVDLVGLKTPTAVEIRRNLPAGACSPQWFSAGVIADLEHCNYAIILDEWERAIGLTANLSANGWKIARVDSERGAKKYVVYQLTPPVH